MWGMENQYIVINLLLKNIWMTNYGKLYNVIEKNPSTHKVIVLPMSTSDCARIFEAN